MIARLQGIDLQIIGNADVAPGQRGFADQLARTKAHLGIDESKPRSRKQRWPGYAAAVAVCAIATALAWALFGRFEATNLVMVYLLGVLGVAYRYGRGPAIAASMLSVALFDFLFVPPYYSFAVSDSQYLLTFAVMLVVGVVISNLTASVRLQARVAQHRQLRTEALYTMTRELSRASSQDDVVTLAVQHVSTVFQAQAVVLLPGKSGTIAYPTAAGIYGSFHGADLGIARWVMPTASPPGSARTPWPAPTLCIFRSLRRIRSSAYWRCCPRGANACSFPSNAICSKPSRARSLPRSNACSWRPSGPNSRARPRRRACAIRCSTRSRTICVRRWRCLSVRRRA